MQSTPPFPSHISCDVREAECRTERALLWSCSPWPSHHSLRWSRADLPEWSGSCSTRAGKSLPRGCWACGWWLWSQTCVAVPTAPNGLVEGRAVAVIPYCVLQFSIYSCINTALCSTEKNLNPPRSCFHPAEHETAISSLSLHRAALKFYKATPKGLS